MLSNVPSTLIMTLLVIFGLIAFVAVVIGLIWMIKKIIKSDKETKISSVLTILAVLIAAASWIFNMGWLRLILTFLLVPFIHAAILIAVSIVASKFYKTSNFMSLFNTLFLSSYAVAYVCLPDFDDVKIYCFFTLVRENNLIMFVCSALVAIMISLHVLMFVLIIVEMIKCKRRSKTIPALKDAGGSNDET